MFSQSGIGYMTPFRIVAIGGGTGLSTLLNGLKRYAVESREVEITAMVTVTDDGGSSGRLRREFDVLPPGDIRNCMVALSEDEALLSKLFQYRFSEGRGLKGHSFGNLFLTALTNLTGDFAQAVKVSSEVLASLGRIYPSTNTNVALEAELEDGSVVKGETKISKSRSRIRRIQLRPRALQAAAGNAGGDRRRGSDHVRSGFAVHQPDPQPPGGGNRRGHPAQPGFKGLFCESDVATRRDHRLSRFRSRGGDSSPRRNAIDRRGGGEYTRHHRPAETPICGPESAAGG